MTDIERLVCPQCGNDGIFQTRAAQIEIYATVYGTPDTSTVDVYDTHVVDEGDEGDTWDCSKCGEELELTDLITVSAYNESEGT